ncbi:MAG: hypothetical protein RXR16_08660 [Thermocladium sp.]
MSENEQNEEEKKTVIYLTTGELVDLLIEWAEYCGGLPEWLKKMMENLQARSFTNNPPTEEEYLSFITAFAYNLPYDSTLKDIVLRFLRNYNSDWVLCEDL